LRVTEKFQYKEKLKWYKLSQYLIKELSTTELVIRRNNRDKYHKNLSIQTYKTTIDSHHNSETNYESKRKIKYYVQIMGKTENLQ